MADKPRYPIVYPTNAPQAPSRDAQDDGEKSIERIRREIEGLLSCEKFSYFPLKQAIFVLRWCYQKYEEICNSVLWLPSSENAAVNRCSSPCPSRCAYPN